MKAIKENSIRYYKYDNYEYISNNTGGMYHYWDEHKGGAWCGYTPRLAYPTVVTSIEIQIGGWTNEFHEGYVDNIWLDGSNDGINWVSVKGFGNRQGCGTTHILDCSDNTEAYNYYRLYAENRGWAYNDALSVSSVRYMGNQTIVVDGDEHNYDFFVEYNKCYTLNDFNKRVYYKYVEETWEQPILTGNETLINNESIIVTASSNHDSYTNIYAVMDGVKSGTNQQNVWMTSNSSIGWWQVKFPYKLKITGLKFYNGYGENTSDDIPIQGRFYTSEDKVVPIGNAISTTDVAWDTTTIQNIPQQGIITDTIYFQKTGGGAYAGIGEIEITATKLLIVESDETDYDFYKDVYRKYYKYNYEPWTQPIATGETTYLFEGNMVTTDSNHLDNRFAWKAMDGVKSGGDTEAGWGVYNTSATQWWQLKLPYKIKITGLKCYQRADSTPANANTIGRFYTSSDMTTPIGDEYNETRSTNWSMKEIENIPQSGIITDTLYFQKTGGGNYGGLGEVEITATKQIFEESDEIDYDFYKDIQKGHAFKSYERGQYYLNKLSEA